MSNNQFVPSFHLHELRMGQDMAARADERSEVQPDTKHETQSPEGGEEKESWNLGPPRCIVPGCRVEVRQEKALCYGHSRYYKRRLRESVAQSS